MCFNQLFSVTHHPTLVFLSNFPATILYRYNSLWSSRLRPEFMKFISRIRDFLAPPTISGIFFLGTLLREFFFWGVHLLLRGFLIFWVRQLHVRIFHSGTFGNLSTELGNILSVGFPILISAPHPPPIPDNSLAFRELVTGLCVLVQSIKRISIV